MPTPTTNCQVIAFGPTQPLNPSMPMAATQPNTSGVPSANPAVMVLSRRCAQAFFRSSSMPAIITNSITAHQAMPFNDWMTAPLKTNP